MSSILDPVIDRLKQVGPTQWERIGKEAGVGKTFPRKLVYGDRQNPKVGSIQKLIDYFKAADAKRIKKPQPQAQE